MTSELVPRWEGYQDTEMIGGVELPLGSMTLEQLVELEAEATERLEDARTDLMILTEYRQRMYPQIQAEVVHIGRRKLGRR